MSSRLFFCFLWLTVLTSCQTGSSGNSAVLSSNVHIRVAPYGIGSKVTSTYPTIFLTGGNKVCRPSPFINREALKVLKDASLDTEFLDLLFSSETNVTVAAEAEAEVSTQNNKPVTVNVEDNWLYFGLWISNANKGENNLFLIIRDIAWFATAKHKGETYSAQGSIDAPYCDGPAYLYLIPPNQKITYSPVSNNPFHNLTIYLDGFQIVDRSKISGGAEGTSVDSSFLSSNEIVVIPRYRVHIILRGSFITKSGIEVAPFIKKISFNGLSSLK